jgi:hypothetical protein
MTPLESYYKTNNILARSQARKLYRHLKATVFKILQDEAKQATGREKLIFKKAIRLLKEKL